MKEGAVSLKSRGEWDLWWLVTLSVLAIAIATRLVAITADNPSFDNYALMIGVEKPFSEYSGGGYWLPLVVHYWVSYRVFGGSLFGYLVLPVVSSIATILVVYWGLRRHWHTTLSICFFTLAVLVLNRHSLGLASYAMFTYANSLLVSCCLFFLFLRLSMGGLTRRAWIWITVCIIPAAFFSNFTLAVPVVTGVFSVVAFRWWQSSTQRNLKNAGQSFVGMWPLFIFPLTYLALQVLHPYTNLDIRPDLAPQFFYSSTYPHNLWGAAEFVLNSTAWLFYGLLVPYPLGGGLTKPVWIVVGVVVAIIMTMLVIRLIQRRLDPKISFTLVFFAVTFSAVVVGGLSGLYPFGKSRYADYLLIPAAVLIGYIASQAFEWTLSKIGTTVKNNKFLPLALATTIIISGTYFNIQEYHSNSTKKIQDAAAFQEIQNSNADLILLSSYMDPVLAVRASDVYASAYSMGWGIFWGNGSDGGVPDEIIEALTGNSALGPMKNILVIAPSAKVFADMYPSWSDFMAAYFKEVRNVEAPSIWAGYFVRKWCRLSDP